MVNGPTLMGSANSTTIRRFIQPANTTATARSAASPPMVHIQGAPARSKNRVSRSVLRQNRTDCVGIILPKSRARPTEPGHEIKETRPAFLAIILPVSKVDLMQRQLPEAPLRRLP